MKREELRELGLTDEQIDSVLDKVHSENRENESRLTVVTQERDALKTQVEEMSEKIKEYDGVDVAELKNASEKIKSDYESRIQKILKDNAIRDALVGVKHSDLLAKEIDLEKLTIVDGKIEGIDSQVETLKEKYSDLFNNEPVVKGAKPMNSNKESHGITREQIEKIKDPIEQQRLIAENIELFND